MEHKTKAIEEKLNVFPMMNFTWRLMMNEQILNYIHDTGHVYYGAKAKILNLMKDEKYRSLMEIFNETEVEPTLLLPY